MSSHINLRERDVIAVSKLAQFVVKRLFLIDYLCSCRRLSVLRESFSASSLNFLKFDIPIMALTATATDHVREDILKSLKLSKDVKVVLTTFFRPNLKFSVCLLFHKTMFYIISFGFSNFVF